MEFQRLLLARTRHQGIAPDREIVCVSHRLGINPTRPTILQGRPTGRILLGMILFGKPPSIFPNHALQIGTVNPV
jgi:hypothetical protein